ncbi:hypothetical protein ACSDQ9_03005 [Aestuariimicrobium soli]|uniref:hypothetical protein n=1 Tax=Aestuariimicrobium soli TaxID=2035834 RepID=UPI003EBAA136
MNTPNGPETSGSRAAEAQRAQKSGARGYSADTDDWMHVVEHDEQRIDPNREVSSSRQGRPAGMPLMPMAGGHAGTGTAGGLGGAGAAGAAASAQLPGSVAAGSVAAGGGALSRGVSGAAGSGGFGTSAAGAHVEGGIDTDGDGIADLFPDADGAGAGGWGTGGWGASSGSTPYVPGTHTFEPGPGYGSGWTGGGVRPGDVIDVDPGNLTTTGQGWARVGDELASVLGMAQQRSAGDSDIFGFVTPPSEQYRGLQRDVATWAQNAQRTFTEMGMKLSANAGSYRTLQDDQIRQSGTINEEQ